MDSEAGRVFAGRLDADRLSIDTTLEFDERVGSVLPASDGGLVVAGERAVHVLDPDGRRTRSIRILPDDVDSRLNDAACDPAGRLLVGSISHDGRTGEESLWSVAGDGGVTRLVDGVTVSNGIGFSPDGSRMYYVDSRPGVIRVFDYDADSGACGAAQTVWSGEGVPDGLNVDIHGNLWVAFYGERVVRCLSPSGTLRALVELPVPQPTCAAFVGGHRDRLVVTTARRKLSEPDLARWPDAGALFVVEVGVAGLPVVPWAGSTA